MQETVKQEEEKASPKNARGQQTIVLADRCSICCVTYLKLKASDNAWVDMKNLIESNGALERYRRSHVILFEPVEAFIEDDEGIRASGPSLERLWQVHASFEETVKALEVPIGLRLGEATKSIAERVARIIEVCCEPEGVRGIGRPWPRSIVGGV